MAKGGIYDQLGGGFHRYSVDRKWLVPHFEKMLYDNAQLLHLYSEAFQVEPRPLFAKVVRETVAYLEREMTSKEGAFFAAQDADSEGEEGKFFVWRPEELEAVLGAKGAALVSAHFDVRPEGNFEHGATVLEVKAELPEAQAELEAAKKKLFEARRLRIAPGRDDKVLTGWNGLTIRGLAFAARVFDRPEWAALAARAADFLLATLWKDGRLYRSFQEGAARIEGVLEDYGDLALGLTALFQATFEVKYLEAARALNQAAVALFWDEGKQAYLAAPRGQKDLLVPTYALHDNAYPSGASALTEAQVTLAALTGDEAALKQAERYVKRLRDEMARNPFGYGHLWLAADALLDGAAEVTVVAPRGAERPFLRAVNQTYAPTTALVWVEPGGPAAAVRAVTEGRDLVGGRPAAYLCRGFTCLPPTTEPAELATRLDPGEGARLQPPA
jgi:uncharacterized protein YyaL (SSP411 family)